MNYYQQSPFQGMQSFFRQKSALPVLIMINIAVWILVQIVRVGIFLYNEPETASPLESVMDNFAVPASLPGLIAKPWTLLTYMFLHISIWHILFNMLWLFWFGKIFLEYLSQRQLVTVYLAGGLAGALVYILAFNFFPVFRPGLDVSHALGASASVMAIVTAISFRVPDYTIHLLFIGRIRIVYLAIALFIFDFFMIPSGNAGGHIAHIGGALFGFLYIMILRPAPGYHRVHFFSAGRMKEFFGKWYKKRSREQEQRGRPLSDDEYNARKADHQRRIDEILEKISRGGYDSLTKEEKELLFRSSGKQ